MVVPAAVVQRGPQGDYAFLITANDKTATNRPAAAYKSSGTNGTNDNSEIMTAKMQAVTDEIIGSDALIDSGLTPGQRVVVEGQYKLQDGSLVKISKPNRSTNSVPEKTASSNVDSAL